MTDAEWDAEHLARGMNITAKPLNELPAVLGVVVFVKLFSSFELFCPYQSLERNGCTTNFQLFH